MLPSARINATKCASFASSVTSFGGRCRKRQVTDFVDDKQREAAKEPDLLAQGALTIGLGERADEITEWREVDATAGLDGLDAERERQMALARSRRAEEVYDFTTVDELQLG